MRETYPDAKVPIMQFLRNVLSAWWDAPGAEQFAQLDVVVELTSRTDSPAECGKLVNNRTGRAPYVRRARPAHRRCSLMSPG